MSRAWTVRALRRVGALAVSAVVVAGCSGTPSPSTSSSAASGAAPSASSWPAAGEPGGLAALYKQQLDWKKCDEGECAWLKVPLDYAKPSGATINIAVNRVKATGNKIGSLVVNPGGPGASGVDYAAAAKQIVSPSVLGSYDVVGFDPRGVQRSAAIRCVSDAKLDSLLGMDPAPDDNAEEDALLESNKEFADACKASAGPLLAHVSTVEVAKDLDILRSALGDAKLNYLGKSYGTLIGSTYADLFAKNVGRMVLDGVLPPDLSQEEVNAGQAKGFETALDAFLADCVSQNECPLGTDKAVARTKLDTWLNGLDKATVSVKNDSRINRLSQGWAVYGVAAALYNKSEWPGLRSALMSGMNGDGTELMQYADSYADRNPDGTYRGNIMQVLNAVTCLDRPKPAGGKTTYEKDAKEFSKAAPTWGAMLAWAASSCESWPVPATGTAHKVTAAGSGPIVVVGTSRDPATPYEWSVRLADQLQNSRLISQDGDGHTAYGRGNACVDGAIDAYLIHGTDPGKKTQC